MPITLPPHAEPNYRATVLWWMLTRVTSFTEVATARLLLTAVAMTDLDEFHALHSDPAVFQDAPEARHPDRNYSESIIGTFVDDWARWGLGYWSARLAGTRQYIGCAGVRRNEVNWNVYYRFTPVAWGQGYAIEVIRTAAPCAEAIEPGAILQAVMRRSNIASRAVAQRLGMTFCGSLPDHAGAEDLVFQLPAAELR